MPLPQNQKRHKGCSYYFNFYLICPSLTLPARKVQKIPVPFYSSHRRILHHLFLTSRTRWRRTNRVIEGQSRSTKNTPKMPTRWEQASRRFAPWKNESTYWVKECCRKQNPQATPCTVVFSIPVGGLLKVSGITKNGTQSVPATILELGQTVFSYCLICPSLGLPARKEQENGRGWDHIPYCIICPSLTRPAR